MALGLDPESPVFVLSCLPMDNRVQRGGGQWLQDPLALGLSLGQMFKELKVKNRILHSSDIDTVTSVPLNFSIFSGLFHED